MTAELFARFELIIYLFAAIFVAAIYMGIRAVKLNNLIKNNRMENPAKFRFGVEASIAVSDEGLIGAVNFRLHTITFHVKEIAEFEILISKFCITNAKASKNDGILFAGISDRLRPILAEEKLKDIIFAIRLKTNKAFGIRLLKGTRPRIVTESRQHNIMRLFDALEAAEKKAKGKL